MPDVFTKAKRSEVMSRIRGYGNKATESALARLLRVHGITGWRRKQALYAKPDFIFPKARIVVFVDGCFWHHCPRHCNKPSTNRRFWVRKLSANKARDCLVMKTLKREGWHVIRIWERDHASRPIWCVGKVKKSLTT